VKDAAGFTAVDIAIITVNSTHILRGSVSSTSSSSSYVSSISWSHSVGSDANRILVVGFSTYKWQTGSFPPDPNVSSVTFNGISLTKLRSDQHNWEESPGGSYRKFRTELWYLLGPPCGTYSIVVDFSTAVIVRSGAVGYFGVHQSTPWNIDEGTQGTDPLTVSLTTTVDDCFIVTQYCGYDASPDHSVLWQLDSDMFGGCGEKICDSAGMYSVSWDGSYIYQAMSAAALRPAHVTEGLKITSMTFGGTSGVANNTIVLSVRNSGTSKVTVSEARVNDVAKTFSGTAAYDASATGTITIYMGSSGWVTGNKYKVTLFSATGTNVAAYETTAGGGTVMLVKENVSWPTGSSIAIVIRNAGTSNGKITAVYIGTSATNLTSATVSSPSLPATVNAGALQSFTITYTWAAGTRYYFKFSTDTPASLEFSEMSP
jgi:hypothetical protein